MPLVLAVMVALTVGLTARALRPVDPKVLLRVQAMFKDEETEAPSRRRSKLSRFPAWLGSRVPADKIRLQETILQAAVPFTPDEVMGAKLIGAASAAIASLQLGRAAIVLAPGAAFLGFKIPDLLLGARLKARREEIAASLPDAVDLLSVCTQAGLNVALALERVGERVRGPLGDEFRLALRAADLGASRRESLQKLAARNQIDQLDALVGTLLNAERFGTQLSASLRELSRDVRAERRRKAEEQARRAPVKILFPLVFLILPAFVLLTVVPLLLGTFRSLGF